jgi:hypothetical protein
MLLLRCQLFRMAATLYALNLVPKKLVRTNRDLLYSVKLDWWLTVNLKALTLAKPLTPMHCTMAAFPLLTS